jgi:hypothetical protein
METTDYKRWRRKNVERNFSRRDFGRTETDWEYYTITVCKYSPL